jgi:hypothetical protein
MARKISTNQPNQIASAPATAQACAGDLRTPAEQTAAAGAANNQLAQTRMSAAEQASTGRGRN